MKKIIIVTPLFYSDASGASIYYQSLASLLVEAGYEVHVISDKEEGESRVHYLGLFPCRCGRDKRGLLDMWLYLIQNFQYFKLREYVLRVNPDVILVHSSFYNHPGLFSLVINRLSRLLANTKFVLDVRDRLLPFQAVESISNYDAVIACSLNVAGHLYGMGVESGKVVHIPVIQDKYEVNSHLKQDVLGEYGLTGIKFILYAGLIKESKGVDVLISAYKKHIENKQPVKLVLVGLLKTMNRSMLDLIDGESVLYLGALSHSKLLCLIDSAELIVNISPSESLSRIALEAMVLNKPVVLPPNVPEYMEFDSGLVAAAGGVDSVGALLARQLDDRILASYPVENHYPESIIQGYIALFDEL